MVGFQAEVNKWRQLQASKLDLISESVPNINAATGESTIDKSKLTHWATAGFFGRLNYDYKERYLLEVNLRYDGTSRFAKDKRWNLFPSFSAGWNVAREAFMESTGNIINTLKIRGSWGELGNQNTENLYPYIQLMKFVAQDPNSHWLISNSRPNTANAPDLISALLGWETMRSWNIGFDLGMLNNRLTVSFDWFNRKTINMVGPAPELPVTLGANVPKMNNADMQSTGFELDLGWRDRIKDFDYGVHLLLSDDRQKILKYPNTTGKIATWYVSKYNGDIWGFETIGITKSQEEMDAHLASLPKGGQDALGTNWGAGDIMYRDLNGDGKISDGATLNDPGDKKVIGNTSPRFRFGLDLNASWKGFDVRLFFQGVAKRDAWLNDNMFWHTYSERSKIPDSLNSSRDHTFSSLLCTFYRDRQNTDVRIQLFLPFLKLRHMIYRYTINKSSCQLFFYIKSGNHIHSVLRQTRILKQCSTQTADSENDSLMNICESEKIFQHRN